MRNLLEHVRKRDRDQVKQEAQAIYRAESRKQAQQAFQQFRLRWQSLYASMVKQLRRTCRSY
jgi:putative transposase